MKRIEAHSVAHKDQRYDTCGDYQLTDYGRGMVFTISRTGDWRSDAAVFLHEFVEAMMCDHLGVTVADVDAWDFAHAESEDPGALAGCPYGVAHHSAEILEKQFCKKLGLTWEQHEENVEHATREFRPRGPHGAHRGVRPADPGVAAVGRGELRDEPRAPEDRAPHRKPEDR